jgi:hypothetical protein
VVEGPAPVGRSSARGRGGPAPPLPRGLGADRAGAWGFSSPAALGALAPPRGCPSSSLRLIPLSLHGHPPLCEAGDRQGSSIDGDRDFRPWRVSSPIRYYATRGPCGVRCLPAEARSSLATDALPTSSGAWPPPSRSGGE